MVPLGRAHRQARRTVAVLEDGRLRWDDPPSPRWHPRSLGGRTTNAFMEGLFSVFSATKRKARGYRNPDNLIAMLYFTAGHLDLPVRSNASPFKAVF